MKKQNQSKQRDFNILTSIKGESISLREQHHNKQTKYTRKQKHKANKEQY